jgi:hypothetical protein
MLLSINLIHADFLDAATVYFLQLISHYSEILSQDEKFMKVVEEIYKNRHKGFAGYKKLTNSN